MEKIKELIPKVSNFKNIIEEAINEEGEIVKGAQFLEVWRKAYLNLGKENTMEDKKDFDAEFKKKIETDLQKIVIMEHENKEKNFKKKEKKGEEAIQLNRKNILPRSRKCYKRNETRSSARNRWYRE